MRFRAALVLLCALGLVLGACTAHRGGTDPCSPCCAAPCGYALASPAAALIAGVQDIEGEHNTESYDEIQENPFRRAADAPLSTFAVDVDTASYSNTRRFLNDGQRPPPGAVRVEEMINYFPYDYAPPTGETPFAVHVDVADCPWAPAHQLVRIGLKGKEFSEDARPPCNLVFLLDVSGSMDAPNKLPLVKRSMQLLLDKLGARDRIAIAVYAGAAGLILPPTEATQEEAILKAIDGLSAGGSTNGGEGIRLAYATAMRHFKPGGVNRVILATDGDFNVGVTNQSQLIRLIQSKARQGVFLTVLGFGMLLRGSPHAGTSSLADLKSIAQGSLGPDEGGYRRGFLDLITKAEGLPKPR